jgi:hypothetical protein
MECFQAYPGLVYLAFSKRDFSLTVLKIVCWETLVLVEFYHRIVVTLWLCTADCGDQIIFLIKKDLTR